MHWNGLLLWKRAILKWAEKAEQAKKYPKIILGLSNKIHPKRRDSHSSWEAIGRVKTNCVPAPTYC